MQKCDEVISSETRKKTMYRPKYGHHDEFKNAEKKLIIYRYLFCNEYNLSTATKRSERTKKHSANRIEKSRWKMSSPNVVSSIVCQIKFVSSSRQQILVTHTQHADPRACTRHSIPCTVISIFSFCILLFFRCVCVTIISLWLLCARACLVSGEVKRALAQEYLKFAPSENKKRTQRERKNMKSEEKIEFEKVKNGWLEMIKWVPVSGYVLHCLGVGVLKLPFFTFYTTLAEHKWAMIFFFARSSASISLRSP